MIKETITKKSELIINEKQVEKLGKKIKLHKTDEFKGLTYDEIIEKIKSKKEMSNE